MRSLRHRQDLPPGDPPPLAETEQLINRAGKHLARSGEPISETNVWLEQRLAKLRSMRLEIAALQAQPAGDTGAVRGAGVCGRPGFQPQPGTGHPHQEAIRVMTSARSQPDSQQPGSSAAQRRADALRRAAQAKRRRRCRAETAIRKLVKNQQEISFRAVARTGGVSLDFLYANDDLRGRIGAARPAGRQGPGRARRSRPIPGRRRRGGRPDRQAPRGTRRAPGRRP